MKTYAPACLALIAMLLGGCVVQSIQPLFSEKECVSVPDLTGAWAQKDEGKQVGEWVFSTNEQRYRLAHTDEKGRKATFDVIAGKIGTNTFLDFTLNEIEPHDSLNDFAAVSLIGAHVFAKVSKHDGNLILAGMNYDWLETHLKENPKAVTHILQEKRPILTASTDELQKFVAKHASDAAAFKNEIVLNRKN
jgi:hypothetical protein